MDYSNITELDLSNKGLTKLPDLSIYTNLKKLNCSSNNITSLDNLPPTIIELDQNQIIYWFSTYLINLQRREITLL